MIVILLQPGKTDAGALFTSNISSNAFGPRGTATVLSKVTIVTATVFMITALLLAMPALRGNVSVLSSNPETPTENSIAPVGETNTNTAPAVDANIALPTANTNTTAPANANK